MTNLRRAIALGLALTGVAAAAATPASAAENARLAVTPDGTAHFGWTRYDGVRVLVQGRSRTTAGTLGDTVYVSPADSSALGHGVLAGASGAALHYWSSSTQTGLQVRVRRRSADGSLSATQAVSEPGVVGEPRAAVDPSGNAVFVWQRILGGKIVAETRRRAANGTLSSVKRLSAANPTYNVNEVDVAVDASGYAVATWTVLANTPYIQVRRRAPDGTLSAIQNVTSGGGSAGTPDVGVDSGGNAVIAFRRTEDGKYLVQVRRRSAAGVLSSTQALSAPLTSPAPAQVAVSPTAGAVVAWAQPADGKTQVHAVRRPSGGAWGASKLITPAGGNTAEFKVGLDADGDALFALRRIQDGKGSVQARRWTANGTLDPAEDIAPVDAAASAPEVAVEPDGDAYFAWTQPVGGTNQAHGRRRTAAGEYSQTFVLSY